MTVAAWAGDLVDFQRNDPRLAFDAETHTYTLGGRRLFSVTRVLGLSGLAAFDSPWFSDAVKARGSALHEAIALEVEEALDEESLDDEQRGGLEGFRAFVRDTGAEVEYWERFLCDPDLGVAGRMDGILRMTDAGGRRARWLVDIKRALYPCAAIQLAAYQDMAIALYEQPVVLRRAALVLPGDGRYKFEPFTDSADRTTWMSALRVVHWRNAHGLLD